MSIPVSGNHNDLYEIEKSITQIVNLVAQAGISVEGLFVNADGGFEGKHLYKVFEKEAMIPNIPENKRNSKFDHDRFLDEKLYEERYLIERTNAWIGSFRSCLNRFDFKTSSWIGFNYLLSGKECAIFFNLSKNSFFFRSATTISSSLSKIIRPLRPLIYCFTKFKFTICLL